MRGALTRSRRLHALVLLVGLVLVAAAVGGIAWAAIPQDGVYTGCYHKSNGNLRVIDASETCKSNETRITWNQQGGPALPGAIVRHDDWCGGEGCPDALEFTNADIGVSRTLITIERPADGLWDNAVAIGDVNVVNGTPQPVTFACNGAIYTIPAARPGPPSGEPGFFTVTFVNPVTPDVGDVTLSCRIAPSATAQNIHLWVGWATLSLFPASSMTGVAH